jgi:hypothetical protein
MRPERGYKGGEGKGLAGVAHPSVDISQPFQVFTLKKQPIISTVVLKKNLLSALLLLL